MGQEHVCAPWVAVAVHRSHPLRCGYQSPRSSLSLVAFRSSERANRVIDHDTGWLDGVKEAGGLLLNGLL